MIRKSELFEKHSAVLGTLPKEGLGLLVGPDGPVTSAIVSQADAAEKVREQGGSTEKTKQHGILKHTFIRSYYQDCISTWQTEQLIKLALV